MERTAQQVLEDIQLLRSTLQQEVRALNRLNVEAVVAKYVSDVLSSAVEFFGVSEEAIRGKSRLREVVDARNCAMKYLREKTKLHLSYKTIGEIFGGRDHSTVLHACECMDIEREELYKDFIRSIQKALD